MTEDFLLLIRNTGRTIEEKGFVHLRGVLSHAEVRRLQVASAQILGGDTLEGREDFPDGYASSRTGHHLNKSVRRLCLHPIVLGSAVFTLGTYIKLLGTQVIALSPTPADAQRETRVPGKEGWHRDVYHMESDLGSFTPRCALKYMFWLSEGPDSTFGITRFLPGSHHRAGEAAPIKSGEIDPPGWQSPQVLPGDVTIFENRTLHAGGVNTSLTTRRSIAVQIGFRWLSRVGPALDPKIPSTALERVLCGDLFFNTDGAYNPALAVEPIAKWALTNKIPTPKGRKC